MILLKVLIISILLLWLLRAAATVLFPWAFRKFTAKMQQEAQKQYNNRNTGQSQSAQSQYKEGEIRVDYIPPKQGKKMVIGKAGEFVDFEDIKK